MKEPRLSAPARADLSDRWLYIASDNPGAADRFIQQLLAVCRKLVSSPKIGRVREELARGDPKLSGRQIYHLLSRF